MKMQIVQSEYDGIPQAPELTPSEDRALSIFENMVMEQGFRSRNENEQEGLYLEAYNAWFQDNDKDDPVRWWEIDVPLTDDLARSFLKEQGCFSQNVWSAGDIHGACEQYDLPILTHAQVIEVWDYIGNKHDAEIGVNWDVIESSISTYAEDYKRKAYVEFEYLGSTHKFKCLPEEDDWWTAFNSNDLTFDLHYCKDKHNHICIYEVVDGKSNTSEAVHVQPIGQ